MKTAMRVLQVTAIATALFSFGCYTTPGYYGYISETVSKVDGTRQISMKPFPVGDSPIRLSLLKNSSMPKDLILLIVQLEGAHDFNKESLVLFDLDSDIYRFRPYEGPTDRRPGPNDVNVLVYDATAHWSSERYGITTEFLRKLCAARTAVIRLDLGDEFYEGTLQYAPAVSDRSALKSFYERVMKW
jgi:hypothetical protein